MPWPQTFTLEIGRSGSASRQGAIDAYWDAWECLRRGMSANLRRKPARRVLDYAELQASEHWRSYDLGRFMRMSDEGSLSYFFDDEQGNANVYCAVVPHWLTLVLGIRYDEVKKAVWRSGYWLKTPRPDPAALAAAEVDAPLVEVDKFVAHLVPARAGEGWSLEVDLLAPPTSKISAAERARLDAVFAARRCMCDLCQKLRAGS